MGVWVVRTRAPLSKAGLCDIRRAMHDRGARGVLVPLRPGESFEALSARARVDLGAALGFTEALIELATAPGCWCPPERDTDTCRGCGAKHDEHVVRDETGAEWCPTEPDRKFLPSHDPRCWRIRALTGTGGSACPG